MIESQDPTIRALPLSNHTLLSMVKTSGGYRLESWLVSIGTASANSVESDLGCTSRIYFANVTLASQKPYQHNSKLECSETNGYNFVKTNML